MNREQAQELLPIIQAFADGKEIEFNFGKKWGGCLGPNVLFDAPPECYKIKPEPRVIYVNQTRAGRDFIYNSKEMALIGIQDLDYQLKAVKFIEVIE